MTGDLEAALLAAKELIDNTDQLVRVVLSGRRRSMEPRFVRIDIRPVAIKNRVLLQMATNDGRQTTTTNLEPRQLEVFNLLRGGYSNVLVEHRAGSLSISFTKKDRVQLHRSIGENKQNLMHDRVKPRLLNPTDPFWREVGISDGAGQIKPTRQDKFRQVEEFLRLMVPALHSAIEAKHLAQPTTENPLSIVDLGCGSAYLTLAAHQYLRSVEMPILVTGIDLREDSRKRNTEIASRLGIDSTMSFRSEEIANTTLDKADVVLALHACDTATDDAIAWAVLHGAKLLLIAPCCHHDLQSQLVVVPEPWQLVTRHGLLKERFADLLTDALRAQILKILGYRTEVIEFIGGEHTPRNLMIRAVKTGSPPDPIDIARYNQMIAQWAVKPALATSLTGILDDLVGKVGAVGSTETEIRAISAIPWTVP
jgi:SAM-dependent methyltransferase